ncbi:1,2-phenylacetyl-CoA epoxidase subunit PaaC [Heyndrickxia sp. FSL W8-0423]|uniref:1,2-phenylacetyl-CoA epoxidase subunit PaaC n=1 Tax=Heyndrickxia sp. FSL W8-0423 TaxID=2921601 RepID=UPI004046FDA5
MKRKSCHGEGCSVEQQIANKEYKEVLIELLYQLADDDFILAYRGSEWLGLAPHIEEDIAYASINQATMGHAVMYYELLESLGEGAADELAHERKADYRKNAILLEMANGTGTYLNQPKYDWAFTVVRHYFYDIYKKLKLESLKHSSFEPLTHAAMKMKMEQYYHIMHWKVWFNQLCLSNGEGKTRMRAAIQKVWDEFAGVLSYGPNGKLMSDYGLIEAEHIFKKRWETEMKKVFEDISMPYPGEPQMKKGNGREGFHTEDLQDALTTLSEVYALDPQATW